jgi:lysophospholipase
MAFEDGRIEIETLPSGVHLRTGRWEPAAPRRGRIVLLQGRTEFLEKYAETIGELTARGFEVRALDWRGQGLSDRMLRNRHRGHVDGYETFLGDLGWFLGRIGPDPDGRPTVVLAHSMGGHVATRALLEGRLAADRVVLSAPMIDLPVAAPLRQLAGILAAIGFATAYVPGFGGNYDPRAVRFEGNALSSDPARFAAVHDRIAENPALAIGAPTWGWLAASLRSIATLRRLSEAGPRTCPVLLCSAAEDRVVSRPAQHEICERLPDFRFLEIAGARHEPLQETDAIRARFWDAFDAFVSG